VLAEMRARLPHAWLLVPGYGAQGASAADTRAAARADGMGALIVSARAATFPATGFSADLVADIRALVERARADLQAAWGTAGGGSRAS
jgi:orotidine-5'-phosphate decarboxylase